jgi:hypothetical protein
MIARTPTRLHCIAMMQRDATALQRIRPAQRIQRGATQLMNGKPTVDHKHG